MVDTKYFVWFSFRGQIKYEYAIFLSKLAISWSSTDLT